MSTVVECNKLLKFAKEHKDVSLYYNPIGHSTELQLLCFFEAGFTAQSDGSSQGGYILMLVMKRQGWRISCARLAQLPHAEPRPQVVIHFDTNYGDRCKSFYTGRE